MKKVLSLLMMAMLAIGAWAETVVFSEQGYENAQEITSYEGTDFTVTFNKGTNSNAPKYYTSGTAIRAYGGNYFTVSSSTKTITKIEIGFGSSDGTNAITTDVETYTSGTWEGSASAVTFTIGGTSGNRRIASIAVTFEGGTTPTVAAPVIAGETPFTESTEVTITCATEGASIFYKVSKTNPEPGEIAFWSEYLDPFTLSESATVSAYAMDADGNTSAEVSKEFVKEEVQNNSVATVAEFNALENNVEFTFTGELTVSGQQGQYLYAQDATGGMLIYGSVGQTYNKLDVIPAGWTGKRTTYKGAPEAANPAGLAAATTQGNLAPEEMTPAQVTLANAFKYAVIRGATIADGKAYVGDENVAIYDRFGVAAPTDNNTYDIIGVTGYYNTPQFMPLEYVPNAVEVATPVISGETPFIGSTMVTITCEEEGVSIHYTIDGTDPTINSTLYTEPFELTETATVKAVAFNEAEDCSVVVSKEFVKIITAATAAEYNALADGTDFVFTGNLVVSGQKGKYLYAQDETGGVLLYGNAPAFTKGDVIPSGFSATKTNYNGTIEMTNFTLTAATETAEIVAAEVVPAQWEEDGINIYAVIKGATIDGNNLVVGENSVVTYNRFGVTAPTDTEKAYDVYGVTSWYNNAPQFYPLEYVEAVEPVTGYDEFYLVGTFNSWSQETGMIAFTGNDEGNEFVAIVDLVADDEFKVITPVEDGWKWFGGQDDNNVGYFLINDGISEVALVDGANFKVEEGGEYTFTIKEYPEEKAVNEPLMMTVSKTSTGISTINAGNVKAVRYYNIQGVESATPFQGVNIVVREMTDGSKIVTKMVK